MRDQKTRTSAITEMINDTATMAIGATDGGSPVTNEVTPIYKDCAGLG